MKSRSAASLFVNLVAYKTTMKPTPQTTMPTAASILHRLLSFVSLTGPSLSRTFAFGECFLCGPAACRETLRLDSPGLGIPDVPPLGLLVVFHYFKRMCGNR